MSSDFTVDRAGTWYGPTWNTSSGLFSWVLERIAALTEDEAVEAAVREHFAEPSGMFFLSWYPDEQGAEMVRVILGPLRDELAAETPDVRASVEELVAMAEGWADATDVFPVFLPWKFVRQATGPVVRYHNSERPLDIVFDGVRDVELPAELVHPQISLAENGYAVNAVGFDGLVPAAGLRLLGDPYNGSFEHRVQD
ncbi:hypothetical protein [Lentzea sp. NPDC003310]|uniref:hypothetical protein n=1 Tax=Lentzea sp. NPDC003310 TaxID=3154447 RepID=UPI0033B81AD0